MANTIKQAVALYCKGADAVDTLIVAYAATKGDAEKRAVLTLEIFNSVAAYYGIGTKASRKEDSVGPEGLTFSGGKTQQNTATKRYTRLMAALKSGGKGAALAEPVAIPRVLMSSIKGLLATYGAPALRAALKQATAKK